VAAISLSGDFDGDGKSDIAFWLPSSGTWQIAYSSDGSQHTRPNFVVSPTSGAPYAEDEWVGHTLRIGDAMVRIDRGDVRCIVVNVDPRTAQADAPMLKTIGHHRHARAGVYGTTVSSGLVHVGDPVMLVR